MSAPQFALFKRLRDQRKKWAEVKGIPVYAVLTNQQLAELAKRELRTPADLARIEGLGLARIEKYGALLLALVNSPVTSGPTPAV